MKRFAFLFQAMVLLLVGCAGKQPSPVLVYSPGDETRSCDSLKKEITELQDKMTPLLPKTDKTVINTLWSVGGTVVGSTPAGTVAGLVPYLFIDMKEAEGIDYEAFRRRHNRLLLIAQSRSCDMSDVKAEPIPSLYERKVIEEETKKSPPK